MDRLRGRTLSVREAWLVELARLDTVDRVISALKEKYDTYPVGAWLNEKALILHLIQAIKEGENK